MNDGLKVAEELVLEGNEELKKSLLKKTATKSELQKSQSKIEMGLKRKQELEEKRIVLEKRRKELEK